MNKLADRIHDDNNGLDYQLAGDYYIPVLTISEEKRRIGRWGIMYREYLREEHSAYFNQLVLTEKLWSKMADVQEQADNRYELMMEQMSQAEGVTEALKRQNPMEWVRQKNNLRNRVEEIIKAEIIYA